MVTSDGDLFYQHLQDAPARLHIPLLEFGADILAEHNDFGGAHFRHSKLFDLPFHFAQAILKGSFLGLSRLQTFYQGRRVTGGSNSICKVGDASHCLADLALDLGQLLLLFGLGFLVGETFLGVHGGQDVGLQHMFLEIMQDFVFHGFGRDHACFAGPAILGPGAQISIVDIPAAGGAGMATEW